MPHRVAILTHDLSKGGGTAAMTRLVFRALTRTGKYQAEIHSVATSAHDRASVRLASPRTWWRGAEVERRWIDGVPYVHWGAWAAELEPCRYLATGSLDAALSHYNIVQIVAGTATWGNIVRRVSAPKLFWVATTVQGDRFSREHAGPVGRRVWTGAMARVARRLERQALRTADGVFALSEYTRDALRRIIPQKTIRLAFCGVDTERFTPGFWPGRCIISVGRFSDPRKNVRLLIRAYRLLLDWIPNAPVLRLVGAPPDNSVRTLIDDLGLAAKVEILGTVTDDQLPSLYRDALFYVLSSDEEGLCLTGLEAMASGLPVVMTNCGGPKSYVVDGENGFLSPVGDANAFARAMKKLLADSTSRQVMGRQARITVEQRFTLDATASVIGEQFDEIVRLGPGLRANPA